MKKLLSSIIIFFVVKIGFAQKVYQTSIKSEADKKIYVTTIKSEANMLVYEKNIKSEAKPYSGLWYWTTIKSEAGPK